MSDDTSEQDARDLLASQGLAPSIWSDGPGATYAEHRHPYDKVLVVTSGSITFRLPERDEAVELATGDRLDLPAGTAHAATVGTGGVRCLEAHSLGPTPRRRPGWVVSAGR